MLDLSRMFGGIAQGYAPRMQRMYQGAMDRDQRRTLRLGDRINGGPFSNQKRQNQQPGQAGQVTQDLDPVQSQQPMSMMDDPFVSEGWDGPMNSGYNPLNLGMMLGRRNFF